MGQASREKPKRLAEKLRQVRAMLELSQNELIASLGLTGRLSQNNISAFERGTREPSLLILLQYARVAGVCVDVLIDDELDLPPKLPNVPKHEGIRNTKPTRTVRKR